MTLETQAAKVSIYKWDYVKLKSICTAKVATWKGGLQSGRYYMYIYLFTDSKVHIYAHKPGMSPGNSRLEAHTDSQVYNITSV